MRFRTGNHDGRPWGLRPLDVTFTKVTSEEQGAKIVPCRMNRAAVGYTSLAWRRRHENKVHLGLTYYINTSARLHSKRTLAYVWTTVTTWTQMLGSHTPIQSRPKTHPRPNDGRSTSSYSASTASRITSDWFSLKQHQPWLTQAG